MFKRLLAALFALIAATAFAAVDVNKATSAELDGIKGIGPAIATKILDERKKGNFKDWEDLVGRVSGIGDASAAKLSTGGLTVNGQAYKGAPAAAAAAKPAKAEKAAAPADAKADAKAAAKADKEAKAAEKKAAKDAKKAEKAAAKAEPAASAAKK